MKKYCSRCKTSKDYIYFGKNRTMKDGLQVWCSQCVMDRSRSLDGIVGKIYSGQRKNSRHRGHVMPNYTKDQLQAWCFNQPLFFVLHQEWVESDFEKDLVPSVDRKDDNKPYTFDNIQIMDWKSNRMKSYDAAFSRSKKIVLQYSTSGDFISEFESTCAASRDTSVPVSNIGLCCNGNLLSAGGFCWFFKKHGLPSISFFEKNNINTKAKKAVEQFDKNGDFINEFKSVNFAATSLGLSKSSIGYCCKGKIAHAGGFIWKYKK